MIAQNHSENAIVAAYSETVPVDLIGMIAELGLALEIASDLPPSIAGKLVRDPASKAGYRIVVNGRDNPRRQRFTMAHEVAHYILHRDLLRGDLIDDALYRSRALSDDYEAQADRFAAQILLPAGAVREAFRRNKALAPLAKLFEVSDSALRIRLRELRLAP